jgi:hypothetical protein
MVSTRPDASPEAACDTPDRAPICNATGGQQAAGDDPHRPGCPAHGAEEADRASTLPSLIEGDGQQRKGRRCDERGTESLDGTGRNQWAGVVRDTGQERRTCEDGESGEEDPPPAQLVGHPAAEEKESPEQQAVGDDHPLRRAVTDAEVALDRRQRHVHDGGVEAHHRLVRTCERQHESAVDPLCGCRCCAGPRLGHDE